MPIPALMDFTERKRIGMLQQNTLQVASTGFDISSITHYAPGISAIHTTANIANNEFVSGMEIMVRNSADANLISYPIKEIDYTAGAGVVYVKDLMNSLHLNTAADNCIPWGLCHISNDRVFGTMLKNNKGEDIAIVYNAAGDFVTHIDHDAHKLNMHAMQIVASSSITVKLMYSLDLCNWVEPPNWVDIIVAPGNSGVYTCPYGVNAILFLDNVPDIWLRIHVTDVTGTYFINMT